MDRISLHRNTRELSQNYAAHMQRRKRMQGEEARYTLVLHSARKALHITINEYCLADTIHKLSGSHSPVPGSHVWPLFHDRRYARSQTELCGFGLQR